MLCPMCGTTSGPGASLCEKCGAMPTVMPGAQAAPQKSTSIVGSRFELLEVLGRGGIGLVYRARDLSLGGEEVALKLMRAVNRDPKELERLKREIITARRINHPNVLRVYEFGTIESDVFLTMEVLTGGSLEARLQNPLSIREAMRIAVGISDGLAAAHAQNIIHRDIKTENVMFDAVGNPKLVDFGLARLSSTSATVGFSGTPQYMSPELAHGGEITLRSDVYSLGVLLYRIFTGRLPFEGETLMKLAMQHSREMPVAPRKLNATLPAELEAVLGTCLQKDPAHRYGHAGEVSVALRACVSSQNTMDGIPIVLPEPPAFPGARRRIAVIAGTVACVCAVIVGGSWVGYSRMTARQDPTPTPLGIAFATPPPTPEETLAARTATPADTPTPTRTRVGASTPVRTPRATPVFSPTPTTVVVTAPRGPGMLTVTSRPWSEVWIDGKRVYGETPVLAKPFASGTHKFKFVNPALKLSVERTFDIHPGKTTSIVVDLNKGSAELQSGG